MNDTAPTRIPTLTDGVWGKIDDPAPFPPGGLEDKDLDAHYRDHGFHELGSLGAPKPEFQWSPYLLVYRREAGYETSGGCRYLVEFSLSGSTWERIAIGNLGTLLAFLRDYGPVVQAQYRLQVEYEGREGFERLREGKD